jgi:hypothetical protein
MGRMTRDTLFLRHDFTQDERLEMGNNLAQSHNRMAAILDKEKVIKTQIKNEIAGVEQTIGDLSQKLSAGFVMENVECELVFDFPAIGEVSYKRKDNGEVVKTRAMTGDERQMDLPITAEKPADEAEKSAEESAKNIDEFFEAKELPSEVGEDEPETDEAEEGEYDIFSDPDPAAAKEATSAIHDAEFADIEQKPKPGRRPKGFDKPTNPSSIAEEF